MLGLAPPRFLQSTAPPSALHHASAAHQSDADELLRGRLASLPLSTPSEQAYAAVAGGLSDSVAYWRSRAESERRKSEHAVAQLQKLLALVQCEGESLLAGLRGGPPPATATSPKSAVQSFAAALAHSPAGHPSHLSRRVSFNRDVVMVVSPEIGHGDGNVVVSSVDEGDELADGHGASQGRAASSGFTGTGISPSRQTRRLSRTEFNEALPLKQHHDQRASEAEQSSIDAK